MSVSKSLLAVIALFALMLTAALPLAAYAKKKHPPKTEKPAVTTATAVLLETTQGNIKIELDAAHAPKTVANFVRYVEAGHYNGTQFHRVIKGFMVQGGGYTAEMQEKPAPHKVDNESKNGLANARGTVAMARTNDPHSAGAQFFINSVDNSFLNAGARGEWGYAVFGKVTEGMDVIDNISATRTGFVRGMQDVPVETILITKASVVQ